MIELNDFPNDQKISTYLANSYTKIQASRFDPRMIEQMKVDIGTKSAPLNSMAQITAKTQISFLITPFDPSVVIKMDD